MATVCLLALLAFSSTVVLNLNPRLAAQSAEALRGVIGDQNVAILESWVLGWQDTLQSWVFVARGDKPQALFASPTPAPVVIVLVSSPTPTPFPASTSGTPLPTATAAPPTPATHPPPSPTAAPANQPKSLKPIGNVEGEGAWYAFINNPAGQPVGFRTFLAPDPQRAYALAAVVAIDLTGTRLRYELGTIEPVAFDPNDTTPRPGRIPASDLNSGLVVAAFNGGFRAQHGAFGVMVNGSVLIAPRTGFGTIAMYDDGRVAIGNWGDGVFYDPGLRTWRQNGPLIVQNGQVNPHTADTSPEDWGYTVGGGTATWRSGLGLSADGRTLYYIAGGYLTLPTLAAAMADTGAANAVQLDINNYWVSFDAIQSDAGVFSSVPLMDGMKNDNRYLHAFERDFFYLVANSQ